MTDQGYESRSHSPALFIDEEGTTDNTSLTTIRPTQEVPPTIDDGTYIVSGFEGHYFDRTGVIFLRTRWEGYDDRTYEPLSNLKQVRWMVIDYMKKSDSGMLKKKAEKMEEEEEPRYGAASVIEAHPKNWLTIPFMFKQVQRFVSNYKNYQSNIVIQLGLPKIAPGPSIHLFGFRDHAYGAFVTDESLYLFDGNNCCFDQSTREPLEDIIGCHYTPIRYEADVKIDYCTSAMAIGTISLISLFKEFNRAPAQLRPSTSVRLYFEKFHPDKTISRVDPETAMGPVERLKRNMELCPNCNKLKKRLGFHNHVRNCSQLQLP